MTKQKKIITSGHLMYKLYNISSHINVCGYGYGRNEYHPEFVNARSIENRRRNNEKNLLGESGVLL